MEVKTMTIDELNARLAAIPEEMEAEGADLNALEAEVRAINEEMEARIAEEAKKAEIRAAVAEGAGELLAGKMLTFDALAMTARTVDLPERGDGCVVCSDDPAITKLIDYDPPACGIGEKEENNV